MWAINIVREVNMAVRVKCLIIYNSLNVEKVWENVRADGDFPCSFSLNYICLYFLKL